ncbi:Mediator of RNA polymerase II transcription subunit 15a [Rhynchospora pubera]|uniref:Mediator of RNA polymerase II transcription subunit 15a n=1 Tax=Rhynchospora pubera TaxID=906938 RepID=A0AAV8GGZ5_9POAL|nr:Mediator of RNA polymerase II transcription subunit 15a [Rhynchospora pubera]
MEAIFEEMAKNTVKLIPAQSYPTLIQLEHRDWKSQFPPHASLLARIYSTNSFVLAVIPNIAYEFEAQVFEEMAKSEVDYLRKILFKLFSFFGDFKPICLTKDDQTARSSSSSFQSVSTPDATANDFIQGNGLMPQFSNCTAVPIDFHQNPTISLHNAQDVLNSLSENTAICTGNRNQGMDWKEETIQEINYLVMTYGKRLRDIYCWVNEGPQTKGRSLLKMDRIPRWKDELDSILNILLTEKELLSLELKEKITFVEKRILYYINLKELFDCSQEIFSKLDTLSPDERQTSMLNEFIKAFLMEKAKKLGVDIHLVEDNYAGCAITYSLSREIIEIINEWCDHKIRILTQTRPTMEDIEKELSI